ncbi:hypothetical protein ATI61_106234 [Archangium gephyra]|uniref:Secreted protein n=1 Tax=Archangium gephyra TaxID=48 RepID=A0ABX9K0E2_9BACT|nr:hypothetical protein ATI61_106234 [Archangium gephyra]
MRQTVSFGVVLAAALLAGNARAQEVENVRTIITKAVADSVCPVGSAASYVPTAFRGRTGSDICAADYHGWKACVAVRFMFVTVDNKYGRYSPADGACWQPVHNAWPWGDTMAIPTTYGGDWAHGNTQVVCCY